MNETTPAQEATPVPQAGDGQAETTAQEQPKASVEWTPDTAAAEIKALRAENAKHRKAAQEADRLRQEAETTSMAEQGKYKELYEQQQAATATLEANLKARELDLLRQQVATAKHLPTTWAARLRGETLEELTADADEMLKDMPKPAAPGLDGRAGGSGHTGSTITDEEVQAFATRFGIDPQYVDRASVAKAYKTR